MTVAALVGLVLAGCSGGGNPPRCSLSNPARLASSTWPKFRANALNTGVAGERADRTVTDIAIGAAPAIHWVFPCAPGSRPCACPGGASCDSSPKEPFVASPVINEAGDRVYVGSVDGTLYALQAANLAPIDSFTLATPGAITSTAVAAVRNEQDAVFVGSGDFNLHAVNDAGSPQANYWPFPFGGFVAASPAIHTDGTVYAGALNGLFAGVCPNGVARFGVSTSSVQSSAAIGPDGTVYFGADDRELRAVQIDGVVKWAFSTSQAVLAAPVVEVRGATVSIFAADRGGRVYKVSATGRPVPEFNAFAPVLPIRSSPALARGRLYFGSDDGTLYAINAASGALAWSVPTGGPIVSSPAVAIDGSRVVVVVGSTDGKLYFVDDANPAAPQVVPLTPGLASNEPAEPIESSPAIGADGTVYVGTNGGRVYAVK